jgi:hypothetical protein
MNLKWIKNNIFEILLVSSIVFILLYGLYRKFTKQKGSWNSQYIPVYSSNKEYNKENININKTKLNGSSKGEEECRNILEIVFKKPFKKARPDFLRNPVTQNFNLELDCYNPELRLAVEYNGEQHYKFIPYFHKNKESFLNQKYRDELKMRMCKDNNITIIVVPYTEKNNIKNYLLRELKNLNYI